MRLFEVGGCVRDALLGVESKDIDFAAEVSSFSAMKQEMQSQGFRIFQEFPEHFTIRAKFPEGKLVADFVMCRKEFGGDGRHPDHVEPGTILEDLARRDFTVNAIAKCQETGKIIDPHNGVADLEARVLRAVGNAEDRFCEDALRCLRALRFSITKELKIHPDIWEAFKNPTLPVLMREKVSASRKREELLKAFKADSLQTMRLLVGLPLPLQEAIFEGDDLWLKPTLEEK